MLRLSALAALGVGALLAASSNAVAQELPAVQFIVGLASNPSQVRPEVVDIGDGLIGGEGASETSNWTFTWDFTAKTDPFVNGVFALTNNSAVTQAFILSVSLPIIPQGPLTVIGGSIGISLTDSNFDGVAAVTDSGVSVYTGQIDGLGQLGLFNTPYNLSVLFAGQTVVDNDFAGLPGPTILGPAANATIGIEHRFTLTPGDSVSLTSFFVVEAAVPEVGSMALTGMVGTLLVGAGVVRRRRSAP